MARVSAVPVTIAFASILVLGVIVLVLMIRPTWTVDRVRDGPVPATPHFRRGATALPGLRHYQSVPRGFWIGHGHGFIKHLLKVYFEISA
jgi:hypothetical protein